MDETLYEFYTQDEEDDDYTADPSFSYTIEEWSEKEYGDAYCAAYYRLN